MRHQQVERRAGATEARRRARIKDEPVKDDTGTDVGIILDMDFYRHRQDAAAYSADVNRMVTSATRETSLAGRPGLLSARPLLLHISFDSLANSNLRL